jgi:hypothetical protein
MSENTETAEPSPWDTLMEDVLQQARALLETTQNANSNVDLSNSSENETPANDDADTDEQLDEQLDIPSILNDHTANDAPGEVLVPVEEPHRQITWSAPSLSRDYCGIRYPIGFYDPFNDIFPRNGLDEDWSERAVDFLLGSGYVSIESAVDSICDPDLNGEWEWERTRQWYRALPPDVQIEVYLQRNFDLRPGSLWIMAPHDDNLPGWDWRYESRRCIIPGVEFQGMGLAYSICCGRRGADDGLPDWCSDPAMRIINRRFSRRRVRRLL